MLTEKSFDTGELVLNYAEAPSANPPLVLLHGLTAWHEELHRLFVGLAENWHGYALDLRGHGRSGRGTSYRLVDYMRDVTVFLRHLGEPVVLMGHSLGAMTAIAVASEYPAGVRALIPLDPPLGVRNPSTDARSEMPPWFIWVYELMKSNPTYEQVVARLREALPDADEARFKVVADQISKVAPGTVDPAKRDQFMVGFDLTSALHRITCPTLLLYGDSNLGAAVSQEDAEYFKTNLPSSVTVKIPDVGHLFPIDHPEIVLQETAAFLART